MAEQARDPVPAAIADEAARWVAEMEGRPLPSREQRAFEDWLAADARHARAYAEMQDIWLHMSAIAESPALRASRPGPAVRRRRLARWKPAATVANRASARKRATAAAAVAGLALIFLGAVQDWPTRLQADAITATGERRLVTLPDGSRIHLGTNSAISHDYDEERRTIRLLKGEAVFSVAPDASRPFRVDAGGGSTTALGTQFLIRRDDDGTRVTVTEHKVRVRYPSAGGSAPIVREGQAIRYGPGGMGPVTSADADDAIAWTDGVLVFKNRPLSEVAAEIGRYHKGYVRVTGAARTLRVSGVFRIDDPGAAIEQLRRSFDLRVTRYTGWVLILSG